METLLIDRELNKEYFYGKYAENVHQKLAPDTFLILLDNPKRTLYTKNHYKNKVF